jgi:hypothetical protein
MGKLSVRRASPAAAPVQVATYGDKSVTIVSMRFLGWRIDYMSGKDGTVYFQVGLKDRCLFATKHGRSGGVQGRLLNRKWKFIRWNNVAAGLTLAPLNFSLPRRGYAA